MLVRWDAQWPDWWVMILCHDRRVVEEEVPQVDTLCPDIYVIWFIGCWFEIPPFPTASR